MNLSTPIQIVRRALWKPNWFKLDQSIRTGQFGQFAFFENSKDVLVAEGELYDFTFFNQLKSGSERPEFRNARILEINHPSLGSIERIDTLGVDYVFYPTNGLELIVNAEEEPGVIYDCELQVEQWSLTVSVGDISEPMSHAF
jgi:hypothetical protein